MNYPLDSASSAVYSTQSHEWLFSRLQGAGFRLHPASGPENVVAPTLLTVDPVSVAAQRGTRANKWWKLCLAQDAPEMGPAMGWIHNYFEESELVSANTDMSDARIGRLLAFGSALDESKKSRVRKVVGFARGQSGTDLGLAEVGEAALDFAESRGVKLLVPRIINGDIEPAYRFSSPIRQICFAGNPYDERATYYPWMAVRTYHSTYIFKQSRVPVIHGIARIVPKMTASISPNNSRADHVDVAFNPWYSRQLAIIDQKGAWQVLDLENPPRTKNRLYNVRMSGSGQLSEDDVSGNGWGRILWAGDVNSVIACDRRRAAIFDIRSRSSVAIELPVERASRNWNLDMHKGLDSNASFLLTSTNIMQLDLRQAGRPVLSWPHRRHRDDVSLSLNVFGSKDVTTAIIHSRMNFLTTCYQFSTTGIQQLPTFLDHPYMLSPSYTPKTPSDAPAGLAMLPCSYRTAPQYSGAGSKYVDQDVGFFAGFTLDKEFGISERLYSTKQETVGFKLRRTEKVISTSFRSSAYVHDSDSDDLDVEEVTRRVVKPTTLGSQSRGMEDAVRKNSHRRTDLSEVYDFAFNQSEGTLRTATEEDGDYTLAGFCSLLQESLNKRIQLGALQVSSLLDTRAPVLLFQELQGLETQIQAILDSPAIKEAYDIHSLLPSKPSDSVEQSPEPALGSVQQLYDRLINTHLMPLPENIPARFRVRRERLCRLIATDTYLASIGVNIKPRPEDLAPPQPVPASSPLPDSASPPEPARPTSKGETQAGPVSGPASGPASEREPEKEKEKEKEQTKEPLARLRAYTPVQSLIQLPKGLQNTLDAWRIGENPWTAEYYIDPDEGVPRYRRHRERLRREKRAAVGVPQFVGTGSSQLPMVLVDSAGSGPGGGGGGRGRRRGGAAGWESSTQGVVPIGRAVVGTMGEGRALEENLSQGQGVMAMTQVERGPHGGRKPKGKKRRTGF